MKTFRAFQLPTHPQSDGLPNSPCMVWFRLTAILHSISVVERIGAVSPGVRPVSLCREVSDQTRDVAYLPPPFPPFPP